MPTTHRVILDTDIGTDVDDILALGFLLGSPEIRLEGVTTVYGDVDLRSRMVLKLLQFRGEADIPVHSGIAKPLIDRDPIYWPGHEGIGLLNDDDTLPERSATHAVDFLIDHVTGNPGLITLLAVGPLTNVATAIIREPRFSKSLRKLVIMGGKIEVSEGTGGPLEHNMKCDPEAAHVVLASGAAIDLVPLDVTLRARIRQDGVDALRARGTPYHTALADQVARYPRFIERGGNTFLHDPLAAMAIVKPDLLGWKPLNVQIELTGTLTRAMTVARVPDKAHPTTARVALDLDAAACEGLIAQRLAT